MSIKAYKYRIYANKGTTEKLHWVLDRCRELYNAGLQERRDAYELGVKRHPGYYDEETRKQLTREHAIGYYEQKRELVDIKEERPEYQDIASHVLQDVILRLNRAIRASRDVTATTPSVTPMGLVGNSMHKHVRQTEKALFASI